MPTLTKPEPNSCFYVECKTTYASDGETLTANYAPFANPEQAVKWIAFRESLYTAPGICHEYRVCKAENVNTIQNIVTVNPAYTLSCAAFTRKMNE